MLTTKLAMKSFAIIAAAMALSACKNGGDVTLESNARKVASQGSPYVQVNQGGKSLVVESGKTATTGVHGWVTVQAITSQHLQSANNNGTILIMNRTQSNP
jgi:hypothetical protein